MRSLAVLIGLVGLACAQFPPPPHGWGGSGGGRPSSYPKQPPPGPPGRPSPFSALSGVLPGAGGNSGGNPPPSYDDPIPQIPQDSSYDSQTLPAKLPILAPNGVVEIYNRVVDDLIKRLEVDFGRKKMDPMQVVIRSTPAGPVRVPGYLQRRPFRRPGAALYRAGIPPPPPHGVSPHRQGHPALKNKKKSRSNPLPETSRFPEGGRPAPASTAASEVADDTPAEKPQTSYRGVGKISKGPIVEDAVAETTPLSEGSAEESVKNSNSTEQAASSEEENGGGPFIRSRSDEYFPEDEMEDDDQENRSAIARMKQKKTKKDDTVEDDDEDEKHDGKSNVDSLAQRYQSKNTNKSKTKYSGGSSGKNKPAKNEKVESSSSSNQQKSVEVEVEDDDDEDDAEHRDDIDDNISFEAEPGTGGGGRPQGGYYPPGGPPAIPAKPNAVLSGLSKMRRASDVAVSVDARSAMVTARLLVGPINVNINESVEPKERGIKATIPELEAEMILMERHGVVFLQRFTLDRAYGQDVEISIPKQKGQNKKNKNNSKSSNNGPSRQGQQGYDLNGPPNPAAQDRFQTKMAAHISMEVVKLLRSGNLRVNLMRTAQGTMSQLKLPIQKPKNKNKNKKQKSDSDDDKAAK